MAKDQTPSREDILDAFAMEPDHGRVTLERYLTSFPEFAADLVDLSRELARTNLTDEAPLTSEEAAQIDAKWRAHEAAAPKHSGLMTASVEQLRTAAATLDIPRQVLAALREGKVVLATVPRAFLSRLAEAMSQTLDQLVQELTPPVRTGVLRSFKADQKPQATDAVSFEQILIDAGVDEAKRARLLAGE